MKLKDKLKILEKHDLSYLTGSQQSALEALTSWTMGKDEATARKVEMIAHGLRLWGTFPQSEAGLYLASAVDIELPLLLGLRQIHLVDPGYESRRVSDELSERLARYSGRFNHDTLTGKCTFDFGEGQEEVAVRAFPVGMRDFKPEIDYSLMFEFLGPEKHIFFSPYVIENTKESGYIFNEGPLRRSRLELDPAWFGLEPCEVAGKVLFYRKAAAIDETYHNFRAECTHRDETRIDPDKVEWEEVD